MKKFFQNLFASKKSTTSAKRTGVRPQIEALENRLMPATLGVLNGVLTYQDPGMERSELVVTHNQDGSYTFEDRVPITFNNQVGLSHTVPAATVFNSIELRMGGLEDRVNVNSVGHEMTILGGDRDDLITLGSDERGMDGITGNVFVRGVSDNDRLTLKDVGSQNSQTYTIRNNSVSRSGAGTITLGDNIIALDILGTNNGASYNVESTAADTRVNIIAGSGNDVIYMGASGSMGSLGSGIGIDGGSGSGINWLDYSRITTTAGVTVDLFNETASGVAPGELQRIQNVRGSNSRDTLSGDEDINILLGLGGNDTLRGGAGRDILIGGGGVDSLFGGENEDILIGGRTRYDNSVAALQAIMAEWGSTNSYATRTARISGQQTGGANGLFRFNSGTVFDDNVRDSLFGGYGDASDTTGRDWFFCLPANSTTELRDRAPNERVN